MAMERDHGFLQAVKSVSREGSRARAGMSLLAGLCLLLSCCGSDPPAFVCSDGIGCVTLRPGAPVKIGVLETLSGGSGPGGIEQYRAVRLAVAERGGRLLGHPVELILVDDHCSAEGGANGALRLVADPFVLGIVGTNCSGAALTAARIMSQAGLVMVSGSNTAPSLTAVDGRPGGDWHPGYFRTSWSDAVLGKAAADFAFRQVEVERVALVHSGDAYSLGLAEVFGDHFRRLGGRIVAEIPVDPEETDHRPTLRTVVYAEAQMVFFPLGQPLACAALVRQARTMEGREPLIFLGAEAIISEIFIDAVGPAGVGVYMIGPAAVKGDAAADLRRRYAEEYGEPPPSTYYAFAFDAANLLMDAVADASVREGDGTLHLGRKALRDALYATRNRQGVTGALTCDRFGDCGTVRLCVLRLTNPHAGIRGLLDSEVCAVPPRSPDPGPDGEAP